MLLCLAQDRYELGCTPAGEPYAIPTSGPRVVRSLRGGRGSLRAELARAYYELTGSAASQSALADACLTIDGLAQQVEPVDLHLRVATHRADLVLDLGDATGRAVVITPAGWRIVDEPQVRFRRTAATGALPDPAAGGDLSLLWNAVNVAERYRPLALAVLVAELMPDLPHPVVYLSGEQGTGKTTATARLASILDPSPAQVRKPPRDVETWTTAAAGSWVVALDNLSDIPDWLSDALCRASTGEGDLRRRLYTDGDLHVIAFRRAIIINGIDVGAVRPDLADRLVHLPLAGITGTNRRPEKQMTAQWRQHHPHVLGAILNLAVKVLAALPNIQLAELPRMADFALVLAAVDQVLGTHGLDTYRGLADELAADAATTDPLLIALKVTVASEWTYTSAELLAAINTTAREAAINPDKWRAPRGWPGSARALTAVLHRQAPTLRRVGWTVTEIPREDSRDKVLRWQLTPPPDDKTARPQSKAANDAAIAATPHDDTSSQVKAPTDSAANSAANPRQAHTVAAPMPQSAANTHDAAALAAALAAPTTPALTSENKDHAANAANAAPNASLLQPPNPPEPRCCKDGRPLSSTCTICQQSPTFWETFIAAWQHDATKDAAS